MFLYKLTFASGKVYIGQTIKTVEHRFNSHRNNVTAGSVLPVYNAWRKHGEPTVETIAVCGSLSELNAAEIAAIAEHGCVSPMGYNLAGGGQNYMMHAATKAKLAAKAVLRRASAETRAKVSAASKAHWQSPEYREKVFVGVKASYTDERREAISASSSATHKGRKKSPEHIQKMRDRVVSDETRAKMSAAAKGRPKAPRSEATRAKLSISVASSWSDPEVRARRTQAIIEAKAQEKPWTDERRQALADRNRHRFAAMREKKAAAQ